MPVLSIVFIVLQLIVFLCMWWAVPTVMLVVVTMMVVVVTVMVLVVVAPMVVANVMFNVLHSILHLLLPPLWQVPAGRPLGISSTGLYIHTTGWLAVLGVALVLRSAVVVMVVVVVRVLGPLWFRPQELLSLLSFTLLRPLLVHWGWSGLLVQMVLTGTLPLRSCRLLVPRFFLQHKICLLSTYIRTECQKVFFAVNKFRNLSKNSIYLWVMVILNPNSCKRVVSRRLTLLKAHDFEWHMTRPLKADSPHHHGRPSCAIGHWSTIQIDCIVGNHTFCWWHPYTEKEKHGKES